MSTEPIERECEICGTYFTTTNKLRKYCDNCMKSPESEKRRLSKALHYSRIRTSDPKKIEVTCEKCGREVVTTPSWRITARDKKGLPHDFCCRHCIQGNSPGSPQAISSVLAVYSSRIPLSKRCRVCFPSFLRFPLQFRAFLYYFRRQFPYFHSLIRLK